ncbi:MAG: AtpZ/AtpI family protein [Cohaesibacter sp.]|nr:AtpZ/AtpI family protein [Cohaesibacter sp.]
MSETEKQPEAKSPETNELDNRLEDLDAKLAQLSQKEQTGKQGEQTEQTGASGLAMAWRLGSEFIAGVFVGGAIGWLVDTWFGLAPWGMIIFVLLGFMAGMLNMLRSAGKIAPPGQ